MRLIANCKVQIAKCITRACTLGTGAISICNLQFTIYNGFSPDRITNLTELQRFAEHVRITCSKILAANAAGNHREAAELTAALGAMASSLLDKGGMDRDASDPFRYDLTTLPSPDGSEDVE